MPTWPERAIDAAARFWARVSVPSYWCQRVADGWAVVSRFAKNRAFSWAKRARRWMDQGR